MGLHNFRNDKKVFFQKVLKSTVEHEFCFACLGQVLALKELGSGIC